MILDKIKQTFNNENINLDTKISDLGIDSLDLMTHIFEVEEEFKIQLEQDQLVNIETINDLVTAVESKM